MRTPPDRHVDQLPEPLVGARLLRMLDQHLAHLHAQPAHGNRVLRYDHLVVAHLVMFFNPTLNSLRTLEDAFDHAAVRRKFGLPRTARSTVSDAQRTFDPALLTPILEDLQRRAGRLPERQLEPLTRKVLAVDATCFEVASRILWARPHNSTSARGTVQLCLHLDVVHGTPAGFSLIDGRASERSELPKSIQSGCLYLLDRAYQSYDHLDAIVATDSDFVVRMRGSANFTPQETRPLTAEDRLAGVQSDTLVRPTDRHYRFSVPMRLVELQATDSAEPVRLLTNRTDLSAVHIGLLYRYRWQIELFFRWLKCVVGLEHFTSESRNGMTVQLYVVMIGALLIALETGRKPTKYDFSLLSLAASGLLTVEQALATAAKRRTERERAALRHSASGAGRKKTRS